jgi:hypothetical protein
VEAETQHSEGQVEGQEDQEAFHQYESGVCLGQVLEVHAIRVVDQAEGQISNRQVAGVVDHLCEGQRLVPWGGQGLATCAW